MKTRLVAVTLSVVIMALGTFDAPAQWLYPCDIELIGPAGSRCVLVCPEGDGQSLAELDAVITIYVRTGNGFPVAGILGEDFWLVGCDINSALCGGAGSIDADQPTDANGMTTISGAIAAGGMESGTVVIVQGIVVQKPPACDRWCLPISWVSPDINGDMVVQLVDLALLGPVFTGGAPEFDPAMDFNCDGVVNLVDLALMGAHWGHRC